MELKKHSFLTGKAPFVMPMLQAESIELCVNTVKQATYEGANAFGLQLCCLPKEERTAENYKKLFAYMGNKPIYVTNYRVRKSQDMTDEERVAEMMTALECGADLLDLPAHYFSTDTYELTQDLSAIKKQRKVIDKVHEQGKEVLMSSHIFHFLPMEEVVKIALAHKERGADVAKIVTGAESEKEMLENLETCRVLKEELGIPFLFLSSGPYSKLHRMIGPMLGSFAWLCAPYYDALATKEQPLLRAVNAVLRNFDYTPDKRD